MPKTIVVNEERCLGCKTCVVECAMAHSEFTDLGQAVTSASPPQSRVHVEPVGQYGMPLQCRHCEDAPCVTACPTEALHRDTANGPVLMDADRCIGCKFCMVVCPFGAIDLAGDGKAAIKCDLCHKRTAAGQEPACVAGCPTGALQFRELDEYVRERRRSAAEQMAGSTQQAKAVSAEKVDGPV